MDLQELGLGHVLDCSGSGYGQVAGYCKCGNEFSSSITCGELLTVQDLSASDEF
jgi:hypothetical protein